MASQISTFSPYNDGSVGSFAFDGATSSHIGLEWSSDFNLGISNVPFTTECWVNLFSYSSANSYRIGLNTGGGGASWNGTNGHQFLCFLYNNLLYIQYWNGTSFTSTTSAFTPTTNTWYHIAIVYDGTDTKAYINGELVFTNASSNYVAISATQKVALGNDPSLSSPTTFFQSDIRVVKGQAVYTSDFTPPTTALSSISGTGYSTVLLAQPGKNEDIVTNTAAPEEHSYTAYQLMASIADGKATLSNDNTTVTYSASADRDAVLAPLGMSSGKWYWEVRPTTGCIFGIQETYSVIQNYPGVGTDSFGFYTTTGQKITNNTVASYGSAISAGDVIGVAFDADNKALYFRANDGTWYNSGDPTSGASATGAAFDNTSITGSTYYPSLGNGTASVQSAHTNFGNNGTFNGNETAGGNTDTDGKGDFYHPVPAGYKALTKLEPTQRSGLNRAALNPEKYFNTVIWDGDDNNQRPISVGFAPDLVWLKNRTDSVDTGSNNLLFDSLRGATKYLQSDQTDVEETNVNSLKSFDNNGFTVGYLQRTNAVGKQYVAWCWKAGGEPVVNTDGTITSMVSVNKDAGFSIVKYSGNSTSGSTLPHGLSQRPDMVILKNLDTTAHWKVWHNVLPTSGTPIDEMALNLTGGAGPGNNNFRGIDSQTITIGDNTQSNASYNYIMYCWHSVPGFSKFGSYTGNGELDGPFIYTGFKPAWLMIKRYDTTNDGWYIYDNTRSPYNVVTGGIRANALNQEDGSQACDFLSNGFKIRIGANGNFNASGGTYIFMAFAEAPSAFTNAR